MRFEKIQKMFPRMNLQTIQYLHKNGKTAGFAEQNRIHLTIARRNVKRRES